jgi:hypothetical protein
MSRMLHREDRNLAVLNKALAKVIDRFPVLPDPTATSESRHFRDDT